MSGAASVALAPKVRRPGTREVFPRTEAPNFRDAGMMVDAPLLNVVASLQKRYGEAFASEAGLRQMIAQDTGHMPGVDTIPRALIAAGFDDPRPPKNDPDEGAPPAEGKHGAGAPNTARSGSTRGVVSSPREARGARRRGAPARVNRPDRVVDRAHTSGGSPPTWGRSRRTRPRAHPSSVLDRTFSDPP